MEREPEQQHSVEEKPDKQQNSMEQGPEPHHGMEQRPDHYGAEQEDMKHELERLHKALCESKAECSTLREKLSALQREFISEEPTPPPPLPASTGAQVNSITVSLGGGSQWWIFPTLSQPVERYSSYFDTSE